MNFDPIPLLRGFGEPLLALVVALTATLLVTQPALPPDLELAYALAPAAGQTPLPAEEVARDFERRGLAQRVRVESDDGGPSLVLTGAGEGSAAAAAESLARAGYAAAEPERRTLSAVDAVLRSHPRRLALLLGLQAAVLLAIGGSLARWRVRGRATAAGAGRAAAVGLAGGAVALVLSALIAAVLHALGLEVEEQSWLVELFDRPADLRWLLPWIVVIGPFAEEVFFRGYAFRFIAQHAGVPAGVIASSVMFAAIHLNPSGFLIYLVIGCVLSWIYDRTGSLLAPVVGHVTVNGCVLAWTLLAPQPGGW